MYSLSLESPSRSSTLRKSTFRGRLELGLDACHVPMIRHARQYVYISNVMCLESFVLRYGIGLGHGYEGNDTF